jgi:hypothetical protein
MSSLFALVDAARDRRLFPLIAACAEYECLFAGVIAPPLDRASPYIVRVENGAALFDLWREAGWGQSWGLFLRTREDLGAVRRRLRHFLQAKLPDGRIVLFRFYDPRVWRDYAPSCDATRLGPWFEKIDAFVAETEDGRGASEFRLRDGRLDIIETHSRAVL